MGEKTKLLVICGPTASGKTQLAVDLAKRFDGEIIGADSMQIYKGMDVGTAKPSAGETQGIPYHLVDFLEPDKRFSVARYVAEAKRTIADIASRGRLPVLCGGTGLYISSLVDNIRFAEIDSDPEIRQRLKKLAEENGAEYLHNRLAACDPALAERLHPNNVGRVVRALEVFEMTGRTMTDIQEHSRHVPSEYDLCMLGICYNDRETLYGRIGARVDAMLENGLADEAKTLFDAGLYGTASQAIGYKELKKYLDGEESLDEAAEVLKRETRRYAKRQMTWFRRDKRMIWLHADDVDGYDGLIQKAADITEQFLGDVT